MWHRASRVEGAPVEGIDGQIGTVERLYFDDQQWTISHLLVHTDKSLNDRSVLVSPLSVRRSWNVATVPTTLSRNDVANSPEVDSDGDLSEALSDSARHVRSTKDLQGFHIAATDGGVGHVDDLLIDQDSWRIGYLVVDTSNWIGGKWVAIAPSSLRGANWTDRTVEVAITREDVKHSPLMESVGVPSAEMMPPFVLL